MAHEWMKNLKETEKQDCANLLVEAYLNGSHDYVDCHNSNRLSSVVWKKSTTNTIIELLLNQEIDIIDK